MTASAALDARIDWNGTLVQLQAAMPNGPGGNQCQAPTTDQGWVYWNATAKQWLSMAAQPNNFGPADSPLYRWAPNAAGTPPVVGVANGYSASASVGAGANAVLGGSLTTAGVGSADLARNVVGAWTTSSTVVVTGTDAYGKAQTESQTGTAFTGKKAFATITSINSSAAITGATFGTGNVLGLPYKTIKGGFFSPTFDGAADAGTFVPADATTPATSSTGDVRGTYVPAGTLNGVKILSALLSVADPTTQIGTFGVTPA